MTTKQLQAAEVDEFVELEAELAPLKKKIYRRDQLRKLIAARYENEPADQSFIAPGIFSRGAEITPKTLRRDFLPGALKKLAAYLGDKVFFPIARVSMEDFDDHVVITDRGKFVEQTQSGYRHVNAIARSESKRAA